MSAYQDLEARFKRLDALSGAQSILHWDMATMMPAGGMNSRGEQMAVLKTVQHGMITADDMSDLLDAAAEQSLSDWQQANLAEMRRNWVHATALDEDLVEAMSKACTACEQSWREARPEGDFKKVLPTLTEVLNLTRQAGQAKADTFGVGIYDALLDTYEPGGTSAEIDKEFTALEAFLPGFLGEVLEAQAARPAILPLEGPFPISKQRDLGVALMKTMGFDFNHGRLDVSLHPFCGGTSEDIRITTRYDEADFTSALMGVLHETGHALYDAGLPKEWRGQPVGDARGMSVHESQSLLMEMQACRSPEFLQFAAPLMRDAFGGAGEAWGADNLTRLYTKVQPDFIRVDADEVTYPAHVILRYKLEKACIEGDMEAADLPMAWNESLKNMLGITPPSDREGVLQDIHWYDGAWGYFPTYTLGAMTAAQLFSAAKTANPDILPGISRGDFSPLLTWLRTHVHGKASSLSTREILIQATGEPLNAEIFKAHLKARYLKA